MSQSARSFRMRDKDYKMSAEIQLPVKIRKVSKSVNSKLRQEAYTPGVCYGAGVNHNQFLSVEEKLIVKFRKQIKENSIFVFESEDKDLNGQRVMVKAVSVHPVSRRPLHIDFYAIKRGQKVTLDIALQFVGEAKGVKLEKGVLNVSTSKIHCECLPSKIPEHIDIDITELGLDESIHLSDVQAPEGVTFLTSADTTLCTIAQPKEEKAAPAVEGEAAEAAAAAPAAENKDKKE